MFVRLFTFLVAMLITVCLATGSTIFASTCFEYRWGKWYSGIFSDPVVEFFYRPAISNNTSRSQHTTGARARWNIHSPLKMFRTYDSTSTNWVDYAYFTSGRGNPPAGKTTIETNWLGYMTYARIVLNDYYDWNFDGSYHDVDNGFDWFTIALHEFGHGAGLGHCFSHSNAVMWPASNKVKRFLAECDILNIQAVYGTP